uniref:Splicing factor cactin central domain-containing protein n=1 Tax=Ostreococcus mediterraneus TaxID=1486918 RepID=A0A7S0PQB7_9CHLO
MLPVRDGGDAKRRKTHADADADGGHGKGAARVDVPPPPPGGGMGAQSTATARDTESWRVSGHDAGQRRERFGAGTSGTISLAVMDRAQREKAKSETKLLEEKEHEFHLKQTKVRADIRIKEGRAKAIDLIARNVFAESYVEFDAFVNPLTVLSGLTLSDMEELKKDLEDVRDLDTKHARRREFWLAMIGVTLEAIKEARAKEEAERARIRGQTTEREEGTSLHTDIDDDVVEIVSGKSSAELAELESEITAQIQGPDASEVEYWSEVLKRISTAKTKANVEEMHSALKVKFEREEIEDAGRKRAAFFVCGGQRRCRRRSSWRRFR